MPHGFDNGVGIPELRLDRSLRWNISACRRLSQVSDSFTRVKRVVLEEKDMCSLEGDEERLKSIHTDLRAIKRNMLFVDGYERLAGGADVLEKAFLEL